jgi:hypothetical protein
LSFAAIETSPLIHFLKRMFALILKAQYASRQKIRTTAELVQLSQAGCFPVAPLVVHNSQS